MADYIEPRRYKAGNLPEMRKLAFLDLDEACLAIMESTLTYLRSREFSIDTATVLACEDMKRVVEEKRKHKNTGYQKSNGKQGGNCI